MPSDATAPAIAQLTGLVDLVWEDTYLTIVGMRALTALQALTSLKVHTFMRGLPRNGVAFQVPPRHV